MKKISVILCLCLFLAGCFHEKKDKRYTAYLETLDRVSRAYEYVQQSDYYQLSAEIQTKTDKQYNYYITLDDATVMMKNIVVLAFEENSDVSKTMQPSIGIFDGPYHMMPHQVNRKEGYVKGLTISGETENNPVTLKLGISFTRENGDIVNEYWHVTIDERGLHNV